MASKKKFILVVILLMVLALWVFVFTEKTIFNYKLNTLVVNVIDGDTFKIASGETIRLICIDAPELGQAGGNESKSFLESLILGQQVILEKDVSETDDYNRLLRYAYINNTFINRELVKQCHASVWRYGPDTKLCDEIEN